MEIRFNPTLFYLIIKILFISILFVLLWKAITFLRGKFESWFKGKLDSKLTKLTQKNFLNIDPVVIRHSLMATIKACVFFLRACLIYLFGTSLLLSIPYTQTWSEQIIEYILSPLRWLGAGVISIVPNIFFISVIAFVTHYLLKVVKVFFTSVKEGRIQLQGFHTDWADSTYHIIRVLVFVFAAVICFPYIPGSDSPAFKGLSVFLGVLVSLGSSSAISNMMSGLVITYMRPFRVGDRVQIVNVVGDIVEKNLLVTRVRTARNVDVTVPNSMILSNHITNYSFQAEGKGVIMIATVTIGYDVPWQKVHQALLEAAKNTEFIIDSPKSFVLQTALNDFHVSYELNAWTKNPQKMGAINSDLNKNILDACARHGIEIMSPHFVANRDGSNKVLPIE
ncbi:putative mechano-sensitive ion channel [Bdellovibrio bacteriovorus W]|nr:putative mechano-sensitive ion channel [Bdellovibrio bacteriovorus W]